MNKSTNNFTKIFSDKKVRYGSFSTLSIVIFIAILLVINLVFSQLNLSADLTSDKIYSISDNTKDALKDIDKSVNIYPLFKTGDTSSFYSIFRELLDEYPSINKNISLEYMDPNLYPQFIQKYAKDGESIAAGSIIVESGDKFKVIRDSDLYSVGYDSSTYSQYISSLDLEPQVTNAIRYVVSDYSNVIYYVSNHNESPLDASLENQLSTSNYEIRNLDLMTVESVPEDCNLLLVTTPGKDWSAEEAEAVKLYLQSDGRAAFFIDITSYELPNLYDVLAAYGITFDNKVVVEGSYDNMYRGNPIYLIPNYNAHDITNTLIEKEYNAIIAMAMPIETLSLKKNSTKIEAVMVSSSDSYNKDMSSQTVGKESGDKSGPFDMAVAITDSYYTNMQHETKIFVMGTSSLLSTTFNSYAVGNDYNFFLNALNWTQDTTQDIYIRPKTSTSSDSIDMTYGQAIAVIVFSVIVLPVVIIVIGVVVWLRRRNS